MADEMLAEQTCVYPIDVLSVVRGLESVRDGGQCEHLVPDYRRPCSGDSYLWIQLLLLTVRGHWVNVPETQSKCKKTKDPNHKH